MTKKHIFTIFLFCSVLFCSSDINAQCTVHGFTNDGFCLFVTPPGETKGQTFQACESGEITSITFALLAEYGAGSGTHEFRIAAITAPPTDLIGGPVYQTFTASGVNEIVTINLSPPFPVTAGNDYAFELTAGNNTHCISMSYSTPSDYPDGIFYTKQGGIFLTDTYKEADMDFEVAISPVVTSPAAAEVPTVGEWGLLILALLFMTLGTLYLVQPNVEERIGK